MIWNYLSICKLRIITVNCVSDGAESDDNYSDLVSDDDDDEDGIDEHTDDKNAATDQDDKSVDRETKKKDKTSKEDSKTDKKTKKVPLIVITWIWKIFNRVLTFFSHTKIDDIENYRLT